jgi:hypothetical protein
MSDKLARALAGWAPRDIAPGLAGAYANLAPDPDSQYGQILPFARDEGGVRFAMPEMVRNGLKGALDLANATYTGALTPDALSSMTFGSVGAGSSMAPRGALAAGGARPQLAMDQAARYKRAAEQGYTIDAYKGAFPYDWNTTPIRNGRGEIIANGDKTPIPLSSLDSPNAPYAAFLSDDPAVASRFASILGDGPGATGSVYPTKLKFENPAIIDANGLPAAAFQFDSVARQHGTTEQLKQFKGAFDLNSPHDGVILKNTKDEGTVYVPRAPQQIRSRFAAFDPAEGNSPDLLAVRGGPAPIDPAAPAERRRRLAELLADRVY